MLSASTRSASGSRCGWCSPRRRPGVAARRQRADLHVRMGQEQPEELSPGVSAGSGHRDAYHVDDYAGTVECRCKRGVFDRDRVPRNGHGSARRDRSVPPVRRSVGTGRGRRRRACGVPPVVLLAVLATGCAQAVPGTAQPEGEGPSAASSGSSAEAAPPTDFQEPSGRPTVTVQPDGAEPVVPGTLSTPTPTSPPSTTSSPLPTTTEAQAPPLAAAPTGGERPSAPGGAERPRATAEAPAPRGRAEAPSPTERRRSTGSPGRTNPRRARRLAGPGPRTP